MSIHLGPMTRRSLLAGASGSAVAVLLPDWASAAEKPAADPHRFALLSDTHVSKNPKTVRGGVNMADNFRKVIGEVAALKPAPAGAIVCGDLALWSGRVDAYRQFAPALRTLTKAKVPAHLIVGNHDHRDNLYAVLAEHKPASPLLAGRHVTIVRSPRANWFLLDSMPGVLGQPQLTWLAKALDRYADRPAIVMAHHDPRLPRPTKFPRRVMTLRDTDALMKVLVPRKHVKAYIFGHRHCWRRGTYKGLHLVNLPTTAHVFSKGQPSAWVLAQLTPAGITLELRSLDPKHPAHGQKAQLTWRA